VVEMERTAVLGIRRTEANVGVVSGEQQAQSAIQLWSSQEGAGRSSGGRQTEAGCV